MIVNVSLPVMLAVDQVAKKDTSCFIPLKLDMSAVSGGFLFTRAEA